MARFATRAASLAHRTRRLDFPALAAVGRPTRITALLVLLAGIPSAVLIGIGPRDEGFIEFWGILALFQQHGVTWLTPLADPISQAGLLDQAIRPLTVLHHSLAFQFFGNPFVGHFVLLSIAVALNGLGAWAVMRMVCVAPVRAVAMACTAAWFAAWIGAFMPRTAHFQWGHVCILGALILFLLWLRRMAGAWVLLVGVLLLATGFAFYEAVAGTALLLGTVLLAFNSGVRRRIMAIGIWLVATIVMLGGVAVAIRAGVGAYSAQVTAAGPQWGAFPEAVAIIFRDGLVGIAWPIWGIASVFAVLIALAAVLLAYVASPRQPVRGTDRRTSLALSGALLVVLAPLTALVYIGSPAHIVDAARIFSAAGLPLALGLGLFWEWAGGPRLATRCLASVLVGIAALNLVGQREFMHDLSAYQSAVVARVSAAVGGHGAIRVEDESGTLASVLVTNALPGRTSPYPDFYALHPEILAGAVSYALRRPIVVDVCSRGPQPSLLVRCAPLADNDEARKIPRVVLGADLRDLFPGANG